MDLQLLREWVQAEIEAKLAAVENIEYSYVEEEHAQKLFDKLYMEEVCHEASKIRSYQ